MYDQPQGSIHPGHVNQRSGSRDSGAGMAYSHDGRSVHGGVQDLAVLRLDAHDVEGDGQESGSGDEAEEEGEGGDEGEGEEGDELAGGGEEEYADEERDELDEGGEVDNEEPLYVNAKQYHRILKRRLARARLEELNRLSRSRKVSSRTILRIIRYMRGD